MSIEFTRTEVSELRPKITVIGVGGAGGNAIANMIDADVQGVDFIVANTDAQALNHSDADTRIQLGPKITEGLGAGSRPEIGRAAAEETLASIDDALDGSHMCFIAAGMGGGTGTGAAPVIAEAARKKGILTVGVVTKPFSFEGSRRSKSADSGIEELQKHVDTLIVIPNQNLFLIANPDTTFKDAFKMADEVLQQGVRGITDLMVMPGLINLDFADVRSVMEEMGKAMMGTGEAEGDNRAREAAEKAIANPLLDGVSMQGAKGVIISITGGEDMRLMEVDEAANHIKELVDPDANIIWGSAFNDDLEGKLRVSVVATGIEAEAGGEAKPLPAKVFTFPSARDKAEEAEPETAEQVEETVEEMAPLAKDEPEIAEPAEPEIEEIAAEDNAAEVEAVAEEAAPETPAEAEAEPATLVFDDTAPIVSERTPVRTRPTFTVRAAGEEPRQMSADAQAAADADEDELLLDAGNIVSSSDTPDKEAVPASSKWISEEGAAKEAPAAKPARSGGTLFERMSNIARGAAKVDSGEKKAASGGDRDSLDIPQFLNRQNNQ
ncbi:cell division protein FtsZ [Parasphingopyxis lamellibrachiae]|uniref:Cell division protein FtsZ n=1 Tax=Parasphingopyxis lamellibrachiae TaxID=680125 RepID=A0A3D9FFL3_9SPHN|nr:cell division protein FtsZ [Parasphingopyxis lamellibrachiae]RED16408.1 cell division protein FtsZ [Parasphingopyxis lamellibrachiae]